MDHRIARAAGDLTEVEPKQHVYFTVPVARRSSGEDLAIGAHVIRGAHDGPTLGLIGAVHGDASFGSHIIRLFVDQLDPSVLSGTVIAVPVANPVAFESGTRTTGQGWNTDMNNMNRVFPGLAGGWVTQKLAYALSSVIMAPMDAVIDYHCGADTSINYTLVNGDTTPEQKRIFDYTRLMGTDFIYVHDVDPFVGTIDQYSKANGKLCIVAEQGGGVMPDGFDALSLTRVANFMKALGMIEGEPDLPDSQLVMRGGRTLQRVDQGGLFYPEVGIEGLSTIVEGGTVLSRIYDAHTFEELQVIRAPYEKSAIFQLRPSFGRVNPGDYGYIIGDAGRATKIDRLENWKVQL
jgi:predicted deacylase